jgi:hypothetical protein
MRGCRVETRRLGSVIQDTGRPRSDLGRTTPGRTMASRYSAPATCRGLVTPVSQAKGAKPIRKAVSNRCLPPPASVSTCRSSRQHSKGLEPARPNRNTRLGKAHRAQIQPRLKIKKTPCFNLILLTPKTMSRKPARRWLTVSKRNSGMAWRPSRKARGVSPIISCSAVTDGFPAHLPSPHRLPGDFDLNPHHGFETCQTITRIRVAASVAGGDALRF